ncbi:MAG: hypothetical protein ACJ0F1_04050 [Crocinitomicaceae bacterium]|nr:hypothetical protein [Crocinitomicaceae bacterium]
MIKILNRGFISVTPNPSFYEEVAKEMNDEILEFMNPEPTIYLIEEDFWDNETLLKKHFKKIISCEKRQLSPSQNLELHQINAENLDQYFTFSFGNLVIDNEDKGIEVTKDDLSN